MTHRFRHHYTVEQARSLLPLVRAWLKQLDEQRQILHQADGTVQKHLSDGHDVGGDRVHRWVKAYARIKGLLRQFQDRDIHLKDIDRGLVDFPALLHGREVFLCWEKDENDIEFWHDLDAGYAGREPL